MLNTKEVTLKLNQLRIEKPRLTNQEFVKEISRIIGYNTFPTLLKEISYASHIGKIVYLSDTPIHLRIVENLIEKARKTQIAYNDRHRNKKVRDRIKEAIELLKSNGYLIVKAEDVL